MEPFRPTATCSPWETRTVVVTVKITSFAHHKPRGLPSAGSIPVMMATKRQLQRPVRQDHLHVVAVYNPPSGYLAVYTNGVLAGVDDSETVPLSSVSDVYSYLGRSLYTADPYAPIKVDEFRIWNGALNGLQAAADYLAGPMITNASPAP